MYMLYLLCDFQLSSRKVSTVITRLELKFLLLMEGLENVETGRNLPIYDEANALLHLLRDD